MLKQIVSLPVNASRFPPMVSTSRAICCAERLVVPLKTMCSTKCDIPFSGAVSSREPEFTHTPIDTLRTCGMLSVSTSSPFGSTVRRILRGGDGRDCGCGGHDAGEVSTLATGAADAERLGDILLLTPHSFTAGLAR